MPNWCFNRLRVVGPAEDARRFHKQGEGFSPWFAPEPGSAPDALNFHSLVPIPTDVLAAGYDTAGHAWECQHWGCQWGACHLTVVDEWEGGALYEFDTAWSPPLPWVEQVSRSWRV